MTVPVWGLELGSVRHPAHGRRGRRAATSRSGRPDTVGGEPEDHGAGGVRGDGVRDEPGHALRPLGPGHLPGGGRAARRG